jgi:hypothetical protein
VNSWSHATVSWVSFVYKRVAHFIEKNRSGRLPFGIDND